MPNKKDEKRVLETLLGALTPQSNRGAAEPSAARLYVRAHFETLAAARERGITWNQIAGVLEQAGVTANDGTILEWRTVSSLFHSERYTRGQRRKRRTKSLAQETATPAPGKTGQRRLNASDIRPVPAKQEPAQNVSRSSTTPYGRKSRRKSIWKDDE